MRFRCAVFLLLAGCNALAVHPSEPIYCDAGGEYCAGTDAGPAAGLAASGNEPQAIYFPQADE